MPDGYQIEFSSPVQFNTCSGSIIHRQQYQFQEVKVWSVVIPVVFLRQMRINREYSTDRCKHMSKRTLGRLPQISPNIMKTFDLMWYQDSFNRVPKRNRVWKAWPTKFVCGSTLLPSFKSFSTEPSLLEIVPRPTTLWKEKTKQPSFLYVVPSSPWRTTGKAAFNGIDPSSANLKTEWFPFNFLYLSQKSKNTGPHFSKVVTSGPNPNNCSSLPWLSSALTHDEALIKG